MREKKKEQNLLISTMTTTTITEIQHFLTNRSNTHTHKTVKTDRQTDHFYFGTKWRHRGFSGSTTVFFLTSVFLRSLCSICVYVRCCSMRSTFNHFFLFICLFYSVRINFLLHFHLVDYRCQWQPIFFVAFNFLFLFFDSMTFHPFFFFFIFAIRYSFVFFSCI